MVMIQFDVRYADVLIDDSRSRTESKSVLTSKFESVLDQNFMKGMKVKRLNNLVAPRFRLSARFKLRKCCFRNVPVDNSVGSVRLYGKNPSDRRFDGAVKRWRCSTEVQDRLHRKNPSQLRESRSHSFSI